MNDKVRMVEDEGPVVVWVCELSGMSREELFSTLERAFDAAAADGLSGLRVCDDADARLVLSIVGLRPETDAQRKFREEREEAVRRRTMERELAELERLQKKYGGTA